MNRTAAHGNTHQSLGKSLSVLIIQGSVLRSSFTELSGSVCWVKPWALLTWTDIKRPAPGFTLQSHLDYCKPDSRTMPRVIYYEMVSHWPAHCPQSTPCVHTVCRVTGLWYSVVSVLRVFWFRLISISDPPVVSPVKGFGFKQVHLASVMLSSYLPSIAHVLYKCR